ncbi:hypothetical protein KF840_23065 [bacterium]|nr:hypothetical protein [bacterium]
MIDAILECLCHTGLPARACHARPRLPVPAAVTCRDFARAARRYGWSLDFLTRQFRGRIDQPGEFFARVLDRHDRHGAVVIPFRCVLDWYARELAYTRTSRATRRRKMPAVPTSCPQISAGVGSTPCPADFAHPRADR